MSTSRCYCSVDGCRNKKPNKELTFFQLPLDQERRDKWLEMINRPDLGRPNLKPQSYSVCSVHFEKSMIKQRLLLRPDAIPTKFVPIQARTTDSEDNTNTNDISTQTDDWSSNNTHDTGPLHRSLQIIPENVEIKETETAFSHSSDTPRIQELCDDLAEPDQKRRRLQNENEEIQNEKQGEQTLNLNHVNSNDEVTKRFYKLIEWQSNLNKKRGENYYDPEFKLFALNLHFSSPQIYRSLMKFLKLPSETTLETFKLFIPPQFEDRILNFLSAKLKSLPDEAKYCTVCVDEMTLKRHLHYDTKNDEVIGLHNVNGEVTNEIASHAYVIMLRGITVNWEQPIAYSFLGSVNHYENLEKWLEDVILKLSNIGIEVMAFISNQESNFDKFSKEIKGITMEKPYFEFNGRNIYYIFDVPHLMKCLRNDLLTNDFYYDDKKISWQYIRALHANQKINDLKLSPKIEEAHINPNNIQKQRVKYAAQVFSISVVAALNILIYTKDIPEEAKPTAEFVEHINNLFDVLNSNTVKSSNEYKTAFNSSKHQVEVLEEALNMFKRITAEPVTNLKNNTSDPGNNTNRIKTFNNIQISIRAILLLSKNLQEKEFKFVCTRRLNQEPLDNLFKTIKQQEGKSRNPTPIQFTRAFSKLFLCNMLKTSRLNNVQEDICDLLQKDNIPFTQPKRLRDASRRTTAPSAVALKGEIDYRFDIPTEDALTYVAGYLIFKCNKNHCCPDLDTKLQNYLDFNESKNCLHFQAYNKSSSFYGELKVPSDKFLKYVKELESIFFYNFEKNMMNRPGSSLFDMMKEVNFKPLCPCFPRDYLLKLFIRFRIFATFTFNNQKFKEGKKSSSMVMLN